MSASNPLVSAPDGAQVSPPYRVEVRKSWSYVIGPKYPEGYGPWRYQWEAEEFAEKLNANGGAASQ